MHNLINASFMKQIASKLSLILIVLVFCAASSASTFLVLDHNRLNVENELLKLERDSLIKDMKDLNKQALFEYNALFSNYQGLQKTMNEPVLFEAEVIPVRSDVKEVENEK